MIANQRQALSVTDDWLDSGALAEEVAALIEEMSDSVFWSTERNQDVAIEQKPKSSRRASSKKLKVTVSGVALQPFVEISEYLPVAPRSRRAPARKSSSDIQKKQAIELYEHLVNSGTTPEDALLLLGPLAAKIKKYQFSFSVSEVKHSFRQLVGEQLIYDRPFMSPIRR